MLINKAKVKAFCLAVSQAQRAGKFTRVSGEFYEQLDAELKTLIRNKIHRLPSVGKTIK